MSRPRSTRTAACWVSSRSRRRRPGSSSCTTGCARSARSLGSGWKAPARTARAWRAICAVVRAGGDRGRSTEPSGASPCTASPTRSTRSKRPGPRCRVGRRGSRRPRTVTSKRSGRCWSRNVPAANVRDQVPEPDPPSRLHRPDELRERFRDVPADQLARTRRGVATHRRQRPGRARDEARDRGPSVDASLALDADARASRRRARRARRRAPHRACSTVYGVGIDTAAILLVAAGDNPERIRNEAALAHLCGVAPLARVIGQDIAGIGSTRGGNRQANHALWRIVFTRMSSDERTRNYVARRTRRRTHQTARSCAS